MTIPIPGGSGGGESLKTGELRIPTSFGFISAKTWGEPEPNRLNVLAVHGWADNAGTFDRLFPLLPLGSMYIVAIDLPGHGSSSHLPNGIPYTDLTWSIEIKRTLDFLQWKSGVTIIAHSMGANASLEIAALFPDIVDNLVMIDTIKPRIFGRDQLASEAAASIAAFSQSQINRLIRKPTYVFDLEKAIKMIILTHENGKLTRDAAICLMQRAVDFRSNVNNGQNGFVFKRDPRLNTLVYRKFDSDQLLTYLSGIRCNLMILRARNTHHTLRCPYEELFLQLYRDNCSQFRYVEVDGDHYVHLTTPRNISDHVTQFIRPLIDAF